MTKVKLGTDDFDVPEMNIGQIEDMSVLDKEDPKWTFKALGILMREVLGEKDIRSVKAKPSQIADAIHSIMKASGYDLPNREAPAHQSGRKKPAVAEA